MRPRKNLVTIASMGAVTLLIGILSIWNFGLLRAPLRDLASEGTGFEEFVRAVKDQYADSFSAKYDFVSLNGLFTKIIGQSSCNKIVRLRNGALGRGSISPTMPEFDTSAAVEDHIRFSQFLNGQGIAYLYVQYPYKIDETCQSLPEGYVNEKNAIAGEIIQKLDASGVHTLNLIPQFAGTPELIRQNFFRTDHHWTYTAAFSGLREICREIQSLLPERAIDVSLADPSLWEAHTIKNWFLGSLGKRVGPYFGGVDDITYYTPRFDTAISCAIPKAQMLYKGDFCDAAVREACIQERDLFNASPYKLYVGGLYPLVQFRNSNAPNKLHILLIGDSFNIPIQVYSATLFQELDTIDPRYMPHEQISEYIRYVHPDLVIFAANPSMVNKVTFHDFGSEAAAAKDFSNVRMLRFEEAINCAQGNPATISVALKPSQSYALRFDDVVFSSGASDAALVSLFDASANRILNSAVFDIDYARSHGGFSWFFTTSGEVSDALELRFYAGLPSESNGTAATYRGVRLDAVG